MIRLACGVFAGLLLAAGCTEEKVQRQPERVYAVALAQEKVQSAIDLPGTVQALRSVDLAFKVGGTVNSVYQVWSPETARASDANEWFPVAALSHYREVQEGDAIPAGVVLATLDPRDLQYDIDLAQARIERTAARIHRARSSITLAQIEVEVAKGIEGTDAAGVREVEQAQARLNQALADLEVALKDNAEAQLALQGTRDRLAQAQLVSPIDNAIILRKTVHAGDPATGLSPAFTLLDMSALRVVMSAPEAMVYGDSPERLAMGQTVVVVASALPNRTFAGRVTKIAPAVDPATQTVACEVTLAAAAATALRPGMHAAVRLTSEKIAVLVPASAIQRGRGGGTVVFVLDKDQKAAHERHVTLEKVYGDRIAIKVDAESTVALGDMVVTGGANRLENGRPVKVEERPKGRMEAMP